jgi:hypothetical protein
MIIKRRRYVRFMITDHCSELNATNLYKLPENRKKATLLTLLFNFIRNLKATQHRGQGTILKSQVLSVIRCTAAKIGFFPVSHKKSTYELPCRHRDCLQYVRYSVCKVE